MTRKASTTVTQKLNDQDTSSVLAYRVGQLEKTVDIGFKELKVELQELKAHYATKTELADVKAQAHEEHQRLWDKINEVDSNVGAVQTTVDDMAKSNVSMTLVQKIVFTGVGIALLALTNGLLDKLIQ